MTIKKALRKLPPSFCMRSRRPKNTSIHGLNLATHLSKLNFSNQKARDKRGVFNFRSEVAPIPGAPEILSLTIDVADPAGRYLVGGWSQPRNSSGPPTFRWALYPRSCVRFALPSATGDALRAEITARAPARLPHQTLAIELNRLALKRSPLGPEWERIQVVLPGSKLVRGQNLLCLVFSEALPPDQDGLRTAASVARIQLP